MNTATRYGIDDFSMPFGFQAGTTSLDATGTNVQKLFMHVKTASDDLTWTKTCSGCNGELTITSNQNIHKGVYNLIEFSGIPYAVGQQIGVKLVAQGTVTTNPPPDDPAVLSFTVQGIASGNIRIQIFDDDTNVLDTTLRATSPGFVNSLTAQTSAINPKEPTIQDFTSQADAALNFTLKNGVSSATITAAKYTSPPPGYTAPSSSTYKVLGKYITFESTELSGDISENNVTITYTDDDVATAGITEADMKMYYFNTNTNDWDPVTPTGLGVKSTGQKFIWGLTDHLSLYSVFAAISGGGGGTTGGGGGGGGGATGSSGGAPQVVGVPYVPTVTPIETTAPPTAVPTLPAAVGTTGVATPAVTPVVSPSGTPAVTASPTPTPLTPVAGIFGAILGAGIFLSLRKRK
jgi:hypothetical protein